MDRLTVAVIDELPDCLLANLFCSFNFDFTFGREKEKKIKEISNNLCTAFGVLV